MWNDEINMKVWSFEKRWKHLSLSLRKQKIWILLKLQSLLFYFFAKFIHFWSGRLYCVDDFLNPSFYWFLSDSTISSTSKRCILEGPLLCDWISMRASVFAVLKWHRIIIIVIWYYFMRFCGIMFHTSSHFYNWAFDLVQSCSMNH